MMTDPNTQHEIDRSIANGSKRVPLAELTDTLRKIGYRLDRSLDCRCTARYLVSGETHEVCTLTPVQIDNGLSAYHVDARRDENYESLRRIRGLDSYDGHLFAVIRGVIHEV